MKCLEHHLTHRKSMYVSVDAIIIAAAVIMLVTAVITVIIIFTMTPPVHQAMFVALSVEWPEQIDIVQAFVDLSCTMTLSNCKYNK